MFLVSDMNIFIISVCKSLGITYFFCHRQISEQFGNSYVLGKLVNKLLKYYSFDYYIHVAEEKIDEFEKKSLIFFPISDELRFKIKKVRIIACFEDCDHQSDYY
ncbi:hypothetical protein M9Y10_009569 [Tritrichomonas musculus]|uniref:Uncharacterized protein n=1 Tax=Tritrichomonas musculus TaxID=1915356 RepID=A0ABR2IQI0_9EUKA